MFPTQYDPVQLDLSWGHQYLACFLTMQCVLWLILILTLYKGKQQCLFSIWLHCLWVTDTCEQTEPVTFSIESAVEVTSWGILFVFAISKRPLPACNESARLLSSCIAALQLPGTRSSLHTSRKAFNVLMLSGNRLYCIEDFHCISEISGMEWNYTLQPFSQEQLYICLFMQLCH